MSITATNHASDAQVSQDWRHLKLISLLGPGMLALTVFANGGAAFSAESSSPDTFSAMDKAPDFKDFTYSEKAKLQASLKQEMGQAKIETDKLAAKYGSLSDSAKSEARKKMQDLKDQDGAISNYSNNVKDATEKDWNDLTSKIDQGVSTLNVSIQEIQDVGNWIDKQTSNQGT